MGWAQQMSWPWPGFVTMNSEPHLVQKYRFPTWFAMVCHPIRVYRRAACGVNIRNGLVSELLLLACGRAGERSRTEPWGIGTPRLESPGYGVFEGLGRCLATHSYEREGFLGIFVKRTRVRPRMSSMAVLRMLTRVSGSSRQRTGISLTR